MEKTFKIRRLILWGLVLIQLSACQSEKRAVASTNWEKGDCLDTVMSPHVMQIVAVEEENVMMYPMGEMGKKVVKLTKKDLLKGEAPFTKVPCP